jgi:hypothetical protein
MRALLLVGLLGVVGCKKDGDRFEAILTQLATFKDQMCACKDAACADKVSEARREYKKTMRDQLGKDAKPTDDQDRRGKQLEADLQTCRKALSADSAPGSAATPPE